MRRIGAGGHWLVLVLGLSVIPFGLVGCRTAPDMADDGGSDLEGEVSIDGSSTVQPLTTAAAEAFLQHHPRVQTPVATSGTGGGFKKFAKGETDISNASRPITPEEFAQCRENRVAFLELPIAYDGLTIVVNQKNTWVKELTVEQIKHIFAEEGAARTWKNVNADWPDEVIKVYSPGTDSGTFDYFREVIGGKKTNIRPDIQTSEDDNVLVQGVEGDKNAIGYFGAAYYAAEGGKLKAVPIVNPETGQAVLPSEQNVVSGEYAPYSRPLFIYVNASSLERPEVRMFVENYLDNAAEYATAVGYFPLPPAVARLARQHFEDEHFGTSFVTPQGQPREGPFLELFQTHNLISTK